MNNRGKHEVKHGVYLAESDTETVWGWSTSAGRLRAQRRADMIISGGHIGKDSRVLEIGCGTGMFTEMFAKTGANIIAVDISPDLLVKARTRSLSKSQVCFLEKRFEDCEVDGPFDAVIGSSILHHLEVSEALRKIYDLLKPNGVISFAEPNLLNPQVFAERRFRRFFPYVSEDEIAFVRWQLFKDLRQAGFQSIMISPFDWLHPAVPESLIGIVSAVGGLLEKTPILREFAGSIYITACKP